MNPHYYYPQFYYQPQDQLVSSRQVQPRPIPHFGLTTGTSGNQKTVTNSEQHVYPNPLTMDNFNNLEFQQQKQQFEMEHQLLQGEDNTYLINVSFLSLLNSPDPLATQVQASQLAPQRCLEQVHNTLPNIIATSSPIIAAKSAQESTAHPSSYKETAISKKKHPEKKTEKGIKPLRKWRQWIWVSDQKSELIEVKDIYKKKKKPYDEWCTVLTTTKK